MARRRALEGVAIAALLAAGCLGRSPATEFYSLRAVEAAAVETPAPEGVAIRVGPLQLPRYLDRPQLALRVGDSQISYFEFQRWAGPLDADALRVLGANLATLLETDRVVVYPDAAPFPLSYGIALSFDRFEAGPGNMVTLEARWTILDGQGESVRVSRSKVTQQAKSDRPPDLVEAHSLALGMLSREIAEGVRAVAAGG